MGQQVLIGRGPRQNGKVIESRFDKVLLDAVDEGFTRVSNGAKDVVYYLIEKDYRIKRDDVPCRIMAFQKALVGLFGEGAEIVETQISMALSKRLGLNFQEGSNRTLATLVCVAKQHFG
jgi:uncharacterized protein (UPF0262 family)